jgi:hypothetical protein
MNTVAASKFRVTQALLIPLMFRQLPLTSTGQGFSATSDLMLFIAKGTHMPRSIRIVPESDSARGQTITFVLAIGPIRQICSLQTTFRTRNQALSYLHKNRTSFERVARERFERGEVEDGVIHLAMLSS